MIYNDSKYNSDWDIKALNQLGEFKRGKSKHRPRNDERLFVNGKYPLIQTGEIRAATLFIRRHTDTYNDFGLKQSKLWNTNTLCITIAANIAETALLGYPMCFPDSVVGFTAFPNESSELFMHYVFTYIKKSIQNSASGSIQDNINIDYLTALEFRIPEKSYQDNIASVLSALDSKIELNSSINAELEAMARTLYDYWFVQFDFPDQHGKPYKSSGGKMEWNDELNREIPDGWESGTIYDVGDLLGGGTPRKDEPSYWNGSIPFFTPTDSQDSVFVIDTEEHITEAGLKNCSSRLYPKGTMFITARGTVGTINIASQSMAMNQSCYAVQAQSHVNYYYLHQCCRDLIQFMRAKAGGSVFDSLVSNDFKLTPIVVSATKTIELFGETCAAWYETILTNKKQNQRLAELRDWLLPMLMNGQVTVTHNLS